MNADLELFEVERVLALFAQGISGHHYQIQPETGFSGNADHARGRALLDRETVYLPEAFDRYPERTWNLGGYRLLILHQLCYREFGSFAFDVTTARHRCPGLAERELPELAARESDLAVFYAHFDAPELARALFRIAEPYRIDQHMLRRYPGIRTHYQRFASLELQTRAAFYTGTDFSADTGAVISADVLANLLDALVVISLGADLAGWVADDPGGLIQTLAASFASLTAPDADVYDTCTVVCQWYAQLDAAGLTRLLPLEPLIEPDTPIIHGDAPLEWLQREQRLEGWQDDLDALELALEQADAVPTPESSPLQTEVENETEQMASPAAASSPDGEAKTGSREPDTRGSIRQGGLDVPRTSLQEERDQLARRVDMERSAVRAALGRPDASGASFLYDEWDAPGNRYLRGWCRVFEQRLEHSLEHRLDGSDTDAEALLRAIAPHREAVRGRFLQLRPQALQRAYKVDDGDQIDWEQLLAYHIDRRRGASPDERVYQRHDRKARDVSALFLVDLSASTDDPLEPADTRQPVEAPGTGEPNLRDPYRDPSDDAFLWELDSPAADETPKRRIIDVQREALLLMADALEQLGDRYGIFGFSGYGRECVEYYVAKELGERWSPRALHALTAMKPRRSTRMGPAIRHSVTKLRRAGGALKVLIVISDGFPQDCDYGPDRGSHDYGVADTAKALSEAAASGIETFCITVDRSGHDYLKRMCEPARYLVIDDTEMLAEALGKVYQTLTSR